MNASHIKRLALVTGGTRGIGEAVALSLIEAGFDVLVTGRTQPEAGSPLAEAGAGFQAVDFSDSAQTDRFLEWAKTQPIDVLINNAGINRISPFTEIDLADFDRIHEVNLRTPLRLCQAVLPRMKKQQWGRIINVTSVFSKVSREQRASYSASKSGLDGMTAALAAEVARFGVLANCVAPGFVDTELTRNVLGEKGMAEMAKTVPMQRLAQPAEIAEFITWLAGEKNTYISGQNLFIDGGFTRV